MLKKWYKKLDHTPKGKVQIFSGEMNVTAICVMFAKKADSFAF